MSKYRSKLPQLNGKLFLNDGGIETTLIFHEGLDLPYFAAFDLLKTPEGKAALYNYFVPHARIARKAGLGFILESPTWRASADWGKKLGYSATAMNEVNRASIDLMHELRAEFETAETPVVISGCIGPRGDGYDPGAEMSRKEAQDFHAAQAGVFASAGADVVTSITTTNANEAVGIVRAAQDVSMPSVISFTVETDGRLPTGQTLKDAIAEVDRETSHGPAYYMINCAHPTHFDHVLTDEPWVERIRGLRANASRCSHAELDQATELDHGDPVELGAQYAALRRRHPQITVLGGCCGTDHRHIEQIGAACAKAA